LLSNRISNILLPVARLSGRQQLVDLSNGVQDLIDTIEAGDLEAMDPYERLDLWQYLQGVATRLALVERALGWEEPESYPAGSRPRAVDISARRRARRARARRRAWASGVDESGGWRASR
jgi:hypothetical protein